MDEEELSEHLYGSDTESEKQAVLEYVIENMELPERADELIEDLRDPEGYTVLSYRTTGSGFVQHTRKIQAEKPVRHSPGMNATDMQFKKFLLVAELSMYGKSAELTVEISNFKS